MIIHQSLRRRREAEVSCRLFLVWEETDGTKGPSSFFFFFIFSCSFSLMMMMIWCFSSPPPFSQTPKTRGHFRFHPDCVFLKPDFNPIAMATAQMSKGEKNARGSIVSFCRCLVENRLHFDFFFFTLSFSDSWRFSLRLQFLASIHRYVAD